MTTEVQQLRGVVHILTGLLSQNGISIPSELNGEGVFHDAALHIDPSQLTTRNGNFAGGQAQRAGGLSNTQPAFTEKSASLGKILNGENLTHLQQYDSDYLARDKGPQVLVPTATALAEPSGKTRLSELDTTIVGMEFVLTYASYSTQVEEEETN